MAICEQFCSFFRSLRPVIEGFAILLEHALTKYYAAANVFMIIDAAKLPAPGFEIVLKIQSCFVIEMSMFSYRILFAILTRNRVMPEL